MTIYKRLRDFEDAKINKNGDYEIFGLPYYLQEGDYIYCDMCCWKDDHTYIRGTIIKKTKYMVTLRYEYCEVI